MSKLEACFRNKLQMFEYFFLSLKGPSGSMSQVVGLSSNSYKPITNTVWVRLRLCKLQKGCTRLATASDKVYQLLAHGWWFSPGTPAFSTSKTGRHDIAEILLKVTLSTKNQIKPFIKERYRCIFASTYPERVLLSNPLDNNSRFLSKHLQIHP